MVIDLGELRDEPKVSARPWSPRQRRAVGGVAALAVLLAATGAAAPVRSGLVSVTIQATAADETVVGEDALYLLRPHRGVVREGLRTIARYSLADPAKPEWEAGLYTAGPVRGVSIVDGMLLANVEDPDLQTVAIRLDTGREAWRRAGWWQHTGAGRLLLLDHSGGAAQRLFSVDLATGDVRWSQSFSAEDAVLVDDGRFVHWARAAGLAQVYDVETGAVLTSARLPPADPERIEIASGLLLVTGQVGNGAVLTAYGLDRLDRRWQADVGIGTEHVNGDCGDALCLGRVGGGIRMVDIATGRTRWSAPDLEYAHPAGPYLLAYGPAVPTPRLAVLDPADGHVVGDLGQWNVSGASADGRMLAVRDKGDRALVARIDPVAVDVRVLGVLTSVYQCLPVPEAVVCRRAGGSIGVWYPRRRL
jgi:outer membrane protein assembly factor BamB